MNPIDQAKTIMQEVKDRDLALDNWKNDNIVTRAFAEAMLWVSKAKASQMLIDLKNEKDWVEGIRVTKYQHWEDYEDNWLEEYVENRLKEINSAIEILEGK